MTACTPEQGLEVICQPVMMSPTPYMLEVFRYKVA